MNHPANCSRASSRRWNSVLQLFALVFTVGGCSRPGSPADYEPFAKIVADADRVVLYEGLPHPDAEVELFKKELAAKQTVTYGEFSFYAEPITLSTEDRAMLSAILDDTDAFSGPPPGNLKCGGYHPDFAVEWSKGDSKVFVGICFGCGESKIASGDTKLYLSLDDDVRKQLKKLLGDRWQNRPKSEYSEMMR
jgi:hypothetical protein